MTFEQKKNCSYYFNFSHTSHYGYDCLQNHDVLTYREDFFKIDIFMKLMIRH